MGDYQPTTVEHHPNFREETRRLRRQPNRPGIGRAARYTGTGPTRDRDPDRHQPADQWT